MNGRRLLGASGRPLNFTVMRRISAACVLVTAYATAAQAPTTLADQCSLEPSVGWSQLSAPPPEADRLLDLLVNGESVRSQFRPKPPARDDAWFKSRTAAFVIAGTLLASVRAVRLN